METRSNQVLVGSVVLGLLIALIAFMVWLSQLGQGSQKSYDIFFEQSVEGLAKGSSVTFNGVPVGQVDSINLEPRNPSFVRVRIVVRDNTPVLQGTAATIQGVGFTGVSQIQLNAPNAIAGQPNARRPELRCPDDNPESQCPYGVPVIPTRPGGFAAILSSAPELLQRITTLTERLTELLSDRNQHSIAAILDNVESISRSLADRGPEIAATLAEARVAVRQAGQAAERIAHLADTTSGLLNTEGRQTLVQLRQTMEHANHTLANLQGVADTARPGVESFSTRTLPEVGALVRDLRATSESLRAVTNRLEQQGVGSLFGGEQLPDYRPGGRRH